MLLVRLILIGPDAGHFHIFCISVRCYMMTYPFVRSIKLFDYRIKLWQPRTVVARANVSSSDRSELLLSLRVRYICWQRWVGFIRCQFEHAFPPTGFLWLGSAARYTSNYCEKLRRYPLKSQDVVPLFFFAKN